MPLISENPWHYFAIWLITNITVSLRALPFFFKLFILPSPHIQKDSKNLISFNQFLFVISNAYLIIENYIYHSFRIVPGDFVCVIQFRDIVVRVRLKIRLTFAILYGPQYFIELRSTFIFLLCLLLSEYLKYNVGAVCPYMDIASNRELFLGAACDLQVHIFGCLNVAAFGRVRVQVVAG